MIGVTITGADDGVYPGELIALACDFPFVEWGILFSRSRAGTPRYPSHDWVRRLLSMCSRTETNLSAHLCGQMARDAMRLGLQIDPRFERAQINGWDPGTVMPPKIDAPGWGTNTTTRAILQARSEDTLQQVANDALALERSGLGADVLFDPSGGRGLEPFRWPASPLGVRIGFAGGIKPDTVLDVIGDLAMLPRDLYWIDLESGVRNDIDWFDLTKVRSVLEKVAALNARAEGSAEK